MSKLPPFRLPGLTAATHTPFHPDGTLAPEVVPLQARQLAADGIRTAFVTGSTGEAHSLTRDERVAIYQAWAAAGPAHGIRVVAHVGANCLDDAAHLAAAAADFGLAAISASPPCYYKPRSLELLVECCRRITSSAPGLPFYYYDIPALTGVDFPMAEFLDRASAVIPRLAGIKFTREDLAIFRKITAHANGGYDVPWGVDEMLLEAWRAGARGGVGSSYNFAAKIYQNMLEAEERGESATAEALQDEARALIDRLASCECGYLPAAKAVMGWQGVPVGPARLPFGNPKPDESERLRDAIEKHHPHLFNLSHA